MELLLTDEFEIEYLGEMELDVYDMEVEDTHTFMANGILVHNSNFFHLGPIIKKLGLSNSPPEKIVDALDKFGSSKVDVRISSTCQEIADTFNVFENRLSVKREKICESVVFVSKKRYAYYVWDNEGVRNQKPEVGVTGLEVKRSSTPQPVRKALKEALRLFLTGNEGDIQEFVKTSETAYKQLPLDVIAIPSGVKGLYTYADYKTIYSKERCPQHVKASLLYNHYLREKGLGGKYNPILEGSKMKRVPLRIPNPIGENVIGFVSQLPVEFGLNDYVDRQDLFKRTFIKPMENLCEAMGWSVESKSTLDDFFS